VGVLALTMVSNFVREPEDIRAAQRAMATKRRANLDGSASPCSASGWRLCNTCLRKEIATTGSTHRSFLDSPWSRSWRSPASSFGEMTAVAPAVDIALFKDSVFTAGTVVGGVMFALLMSVTFFVAGVLARSPGLHRDASRGLPSCLALSHHVVTPIVGRTYNALSRVGGQLRRHLRGGQHLDDEPLHPGHVGKWDRQRASGAGVGVQLSVRALGHQRRSAEFRGPSWLMRRD